MTRDVKWYLFHFSLVTLLILLIITMYIFSKKHKTKYLFHAFKAYVSIGTLVLFIFGIFKVYDMPIYTRAHQFGEPITSFKHIDNPVILIAKTILFVAIGLLLVTSVRVIHRIIIANEWGNAHSKKAALAAGLAITVILTLPLLTMPYDLDWGLITGFLSPKNY